MPAYLSYVNLSDAATITSVDPYTGSASVMLRPLTELLVPWAKGLCRGPTSGAGTLISPRKLNIRIDLGGAYVIHSIGVAGLNCSSTAALNASMQVLISNVALGNSELAADTVSWSESYSQGARNVGLYWFPANFAFSARYISLTLSLWGGTVPHVDVRRLLVMAGGGSALGFDRGWTMFDENPTEDVQTDAGGVFIEEKTASRVMQFSMTGRTVAEMKTNVYDGVVCDSLDRVLARAGKRKEVIVCPKYYGNTVETSYNAIYGRITSWSPIVHESGTLYSCDGITVKEIPHPPL